MSKWKKSNDWIYWHCLERSCFFLFWRPFWILFKNMIGHIGRSDHPIWLTLIANHESAGLKTFKITAMTSSILKKKVDFANICQIICTKFHWNWWFRLGCAFPHTYRQTDAHTHTHTHTYTHTLVWIATYSVNITECKYNNILIFVEFKNSASMTS